MLEIWGRPYSSNVIPVIWTAAEVGVEYQLKLAGGSFGRLDTDDFATINPNRLIPAIRDGDFTLWESQAIVRYLCAEYSHGHLYPETVQNRAIADQWMEWCSSTAFTPVIQLFFAMVRTEPSQRDQALIQSHADQAADVFALLNSHLSTRDYVAGAEFSMGDIPLGCVVYRYFNVDVERPEYPYLNAWYQLLCERPAYRKHVMRFFGTNPSDWQALEVASAQEGN